MKNGNYNLTRTWKIVWALTRPPKIIVMKQRAAVGLIIIRVATKKCLRIWTYWKHYLNAEAIKNKIVLKYRSF